VSDRRVGYLLADVFGWQPGRRYDTVFFAFWLSHVPPDRFDQFWALLRDWLAPGGRVLFVDEHPGTADKELYPDPGGYLVERRLADGSVHRVVKVLAGAARDRPPAVRRRLAVGDPRRRSGLAGRRGPAAAVAHSPLWPPGKPVAP